MNLEKKSLQPAQVKTFLGYHRWTQGYKNTFYERKGREDNFCSKVGRAFLSLEGDSGSDSILVNVWAYLHARDLQFFLPLGKRRKNTWTNRWSVLPQVKMSLKWWLDPSNLLEGRPWAQWNPVRLAMDRVKGSGCLSLGSSSWHMPFLLWL